MAAPKPLVDADGNPLKRKPKRKPVPSTVLVVLRGGPPEWDGHVTHVIPGPRLERWDHTADLPVCWEPDGTEEVVEVDRERRTDTVREKKRALVLRFVGYKEELSAIERPAAEEGRQMRIEDVPEGEAEGISEVADS